MFRFVIWAAVFTFVNIICLANEGSPRIAIVGAGIGGASTTHFLKSLFDNPDLVIRVYEAHRIGGRLATTIVNNREYEVGGSIIHPRNKYMVDFTNALGLKKQGRLHEGRLGLYDGKNYVFTDSQWQLFTLFKMLWRYGISVLKFEKLIDNTLNIFSTIYSAQDKGFAFTTVDKLLTAMTPYFTNLTQTTIHQHMTKLQYSNSFINEFIMAVDRVNYGQDLGINAFVGLVALAGSGSPGLWNVEGGNRLVAEKLLENANVEIIHERVVEVIYQNSTSFVVVSTTEDYNNNNQSPHTKREEYDIVIIATPLIDGLSRINFTGFPKPIRNFKGRYHRTVTTLVEGEVNETYLHADSLNLETILTTSTDAEFNSLSRIYPTDALEIESDAPKVWKIFSQQPLTEQQLDNLFHTRSDTQVIDWQAYPHYTPPEDLQSFVLHADLPIFYTSAIEWAASAMEMSCIAGRNAALLAHKYWLQKFDKLDSVVPVNLHSEL